jgi:Zn-dependent protease
VLARAGVGVVIRAIMVMSDAARQRGRTHFNTSQSRPATVRCVSYSVGMLPPMLETNGGFYLGHIGKVPVYAAFESIFLLFFVLMIGNGRGYSTDQIIMMGIALVLVIILHELGHALVALWRGMTGVSITLSAFGGFCSYNGYRESPGNQFLISFAGPLMNLVLAGLTYVALISVPIPDETIAFLVVQFFQWNLVLGIFNLLPIYPLDGGQMTLSAGAMITSETKAKRFTLGLSFIGAFAALAFFTLLNQQLPMFMLLIFGILLFDAYRRLR